MILAPLLLRFPLLAKLPWRLIGYAAAAIAIAWFVWAKIDAYGDRREKAGEARIQARWDADEAEETRLANAQALSNQLAEAAAAARNAQLEAQHRAEVAAALADRDRVAGLLGEARRAARARTAAQGPDLPGAAPAGQDPGPGQADAEAELDQDLADVIAESRANASQLNALIGELVPQM